MADSTSDGRRVFLKKLLAGAAAGAGALMISRQPTLAALLAAEDEGPPTNEAEHDYAFVVDINQCIGCGYCVEACSIENNVPEGQFRTWVERYIVTADGIHVDSPQGGINGFEEVEETLREKANKAFFVPKLCNHCANAPCVQVCPVGATFRSSEGFVLVDPEHCIACGYCIQACPYGVRFMNAERHIADKCTWCHHRVAKGKDPACVTVCPTQARLFGDLKDPENRVAKIFHSDRWRVLKSGMHTESRCLYIGLAGEVV